MSEIGTPKSTRDMLLDAALTLFADKGFYGTSIADVANHVGLTKQALLHHFRTKERLYGEVLEKIAIELREELSDVSEGSAARRFEDVILQLADAGLTDGTAQKLIVRELMDNQARLEEVDDWYLRPFLDALIALLKEIPGQGHLSRMDALATIYHLLGAINYFNISQNTLEHMYGRKAFVQLKAAHPTRLRSLVRMVLS